MITLEPSSITHAFLFGGSSRAELHTQLDQFKRCLAMQPRVALAELAADCLQSCQTPNLALVASTHQTLEQLLSRAAVRLQDPNCTRIQDASGIYYTENPLSACGHLAYLFPGEGAPFPGMLSGLAQRFPAMEPLMAACETIEAEMQLPAGSLLDCLTTSDQDKQASLERMLLDFNFSLTVNVWCSWCLHQLLDSLGVSPQAIAGHSAGEATALFAARAVSDQTPYILIKQITKLEQLDDAPSGMLAVGAGSDHVERILTDAGLPPGDASNVFVAMDNCPHQVVLVGTAEAINRAELVVRQANLIVQKLDLPRPYHTRLFENYLPMLTQLMASLEYQSPEIPIYSCATARQFPDDPARMMELAVHQWVQPVRFTDLIRNMYAEGARIFVEVGPRANLSAFVEDILRGSPMLAVASNRAGRSAESQIVHLAAQLAIHQVPVDWNALYPTRARGDAAATRRTTTHNLAPLEPAPRTWGAPPSVPAKSLEPEPVVPPASLTDISKQVPNAPPQSAEPRMPAGPPSTTYEAATHSAARVTGFWPTESPRREEAVPPASPATRRSGPARIRQAVERLSASGLAPHLRTPTDKQQLMRSHQRLMQQFLQTQQSVMRQYLAGRHASFPGLPPGPVFDVRSVVDQYTTDTDLTWTDGASGFVAPLFAAGEIVAREPGQALTLRRPLDLDEDLYADQHTLGGQKNSRVDPSQHGQPLMPMTFFLEMVAQAARQLYPALRVTHVRHVHLMKWLPFYAGDPGATEVRVRRRAAADSTAQAPIVLQAEVWDLGKSKRAATLGEGGLAARCEVVLSPSYASDAIDRVKFDNPRPCPTTVEKLYNNLFHGPAFQGVTDVTRMGDQQIECKVQVQPRHDLFRSTTSPDFVVDPITLDIVMHPLAVWHLADPDQTGRIMLPFQLEELEMFGPAPDVGDRLIVEGWVEHYSARRFVHSLIAFREDGRAWCRMRLAKFWRFYLPFHNVNFHGPKDIYYLSDDRHEWFPSLGQRASLVQLEVPEDLTNASLRTAGLQVVFSPREQQIFESLNLPSAEVSDWLFSRFAVKDAARRFRLALDGQTMFAADVEVEQIADGWFRTVARDGYDDTPLPCVAVRCVHDVYFAAGALQERVGFDCRAWQADYPAPDDATAQLAGEFALRTGTSLDQAVQQVTSILACLQEVHGSVDGLIWQTIAPTGEAHRCHLGQNRYDVWSTIHEGTIISLGLPAIL